MLVAVTVRRIPVSGYVGENSPTRPLDSAPKTAPLIDIRCPFLGDIGVFTSTACLGKQSHAGDRFPDPK